MIDVLSVENMRKSDLATISGGISGRDLMLRAAHGVFDSVQWREPVAIVCGSGNNAGDGYALALYFATAKIECSVICVYDKFSKDGRYYYDKCVSAGIDIRHIGEVSLSDYNTIVDCLLGTGFKGDVRPDMVTVIDNINNSSAYIVSVDINSGLNGDNGMGTAFVRSDLTVSVGGFKPCHFLNMAKDVMKDIVNVDIGIKPVQEPYELLENSDVVQYFGDRPNFSNKGTYGYTALIGGSTRYSGAIRLAYMANAAMRCGAGVVKVALPGSLVHDVTGHILESTIFPLSYFDRVMSTDEADIRSSNDTEVAYDPGEIDELISNVRCVAFGMGIGTGDGAEKILLHLLESFPGNLIVDADGLTLLSHIDLESQKYKPCNIILTPHIKEFSRLTGQEISHILADPIGTAKDFATKTGTVVLLKGPSTIVSDGNNVYIIDRGCPGMATAGSGDVLSGILAAVAAILPGDDQKSSDAYPLRNACMAAAVSAYINGAAGEEAEKKFGSVSMVAGDTVAAIPCVINNW